MTRHWFFTCVCLPLLMGLMLINSATAQIGDLQTHKKRKLGAEPPVFEAIKNADLEELHLLWVKNHLRFQDTTSDGRTPLIAAVQSGNSEILTFLIDKKLSLSKTDLAGNSPLHHAANLKNTTIIQQLIKAEANVNSINFNGEIPLFLATRKGNWSIMELLLQAGTDTSLSDYTGRGLLDYAREAKDRSIIRKLKKYL